MVTIGLNKPSEGRYSPGALGEGQWPAAGRTFDVRPVTLMVSPQTNPYPGRTHRPDRRGLNKQTRPVIDNSKWGLGGFLQISLIFSGPDETGC